MPADSLELKENHCLKGFLTKKEVKLGVLSSDTTADAYSQNCKMDCKDGEKTVLLVMCTNRRPTRTVLSTSANRQGYLVMAKILVIDDQDSVRSFLRLVLEQEGHEVTEASNGHHGLAVYQGAPADLVIADIRMPEMNGLDLILELTRCFLDVKVLAISGASDAKESLSTAKLLGARQVLQKPFSLEKFLSLVRYELAH